MVHHGGTIPGKSTSFTPSSILFRPRRCSPEALSRAKLHGWRRRVLPPGPKGLLRRPFITIAALASGTPNIGAKVLRRKGRVPLEEYIPGPGHQAPSADASPAASRLRALAGGRHLPGNLAY